MMVPNFFPANIKPESPCSVPASCPDPLGKPSLGTTRTTTTSSSLAEESEGEGSGTSSSGFLHKHQKIAHLVVRIWRAVGPRKHP